MEFVNKMQHDLRTKLVLELIIYLKGCNHYIKMIRGIYCWKSFPILFTISQTLIRDSLSMPAVTIMSSRSLEANI